MHTTLVESTISELSHRLETDYFQGHIAADYHDVAGSGVHRLRLDRRFAQESLPCTGYRHHSESAPEC